MSTLLKRSIALAAIVLALVVLYGRSQYAAVSHRVAKVETGAPAEMGKPAPDFTFTTLDGKAIKLADLKGKPLVINFWASWCHFCLQEAPDLEALYQHYQGQGLEMIGIGTDDARALQEKVKELGLTYPVGSAPEVAKEYGVSGIPHTFIINREGIVVASLVGAQPKEELEAQIKQVL